jgi:small subunit ribosomal protein S5
MVKATLAALKTMTSPRAVAAKRGKKVADIVGRREDVKEAVAKEA